MDEERVSPLINGCWDVLMGTGNLPSTRRKSGGVWCFESSLTPRLIARSEACKILILSMIL